MIPTMKSISPKTQHFNDRRARLLIIHGTAVIGQEAEDILSGKSEYIASVHYYIKQNGEHIQYLDDHVRAFHAGLGSWGGLDDLNSLSVGIELECLSKDSSFTHPEESHYTDAQLEKLITLAKEIIERHKIHPCNVLAHQDVSADRRHLISPENKPLKEFADTYGKMDPGPFFNWEKLAKNGVGVWHNQRPDTKDTIIKDDHIKNHFLNLLFLYGYDARVMVKPNGQGPDKIIKAFHTHFMPWLFGTTFFGQVTSQSLQIAEILWAMKATADFK